MKHLNRKYSTPLFTKFYAVGDHIQLQYRQYMGAYSVFAVRLGRGIKMESGRLSRHKWTDADIAAAFERALDVLERKDLFFEPIMKYGPYLKTEYGRIISFPKESV